MHLKILQVSKAMRTEKIGILLLSMTVLVSAGFVSNQAFAGPVSSQGSAGDECRAKGCIFEWNGGDFTCDCPVGGMAVVVSDSVLYGELAQQYSLWLITSISSLSIGVYIIKRKI